MQKGVAQMAFYQRIRDLREDADKTQTEIAAYLGTTAQYYGKYEKGERELPFSRAVLLANFYDVSLDYLAGRTNLPKNPHGITIADDALLVLQKYTALTERNKGRLEQFLDRLSKKKHDRPCEIAKSVPSQTIRFFSFRISTA